MNEGALPRPSRSGEEHVICRKPLHETLGIREDDFFLTVNVENIRGVNRRDVFHRLQPSGGHPEILAPLPAERGTAPVNLIRGRRKKGRYLLREPKERLLKFCIHIRPLTGSDAFSPRGI